MRIGLFPTLAPYLLPHVVPNVHHRFPHLELLLVEEKTEVVHRRLRDGRLDAALMALPVDDDHLHVEVLFDEDFVLAVPADHPLAETDGPVDLSVLADEHVLLLEEGHCLRDQALAVCQLAGASERTGFRATSLETLRQMVAAGVGVTLLPELAVQPPGAGVARHAAAALRRAGAAPPHRHVLAADERLPRPAAASGRGAARPADRPRQRGLIARRPRSAAARHPTISLICMTGEIVV